MTVIPGGGLVYTLGLCVSQAITIMREKKDFLILLVLPLLTYLIFVFFYVVGTF